MQKQLRPSEYNLAELVIAANKRITKEKIRPADPRAKATVTARTVQFYLSKGLLPEPTRRGAQLRFNDRHVEAIVEVKRRQAEGLMLDEIPGASSTPDLARFITASAMASPTIFLDRIQRTESRMTELKTNGVHSLDESFGTATFPTPVFKWHVQLGNEMELSGHGVPPDQEAIESIRLVLRHTLTEFEEDNQQ